MKKINKNPLLPILFVIEVIAALFFTPVLENLRVFGKEGKDPLVQ